MEESEMACKNCKHKKYIYVSYSDQPRPNNNYLNVPYTHSWCDIAPGKESLIKDRDRVAKFCPLTAEERKENEI